MHPIRLLFLILFPLSAFTQDGAFDTIPPSPIHITPYNTIGNYHTWSVKGKILLYPLGNGGGISGMLGLEYGFLKNQSIGVDVFTEYFEDSDDNITDTAGVHHDIGNYYNSRERAVFINYRYYLKCRKLRQKKGITPYFLTFLRWGKIDQHHDPAYKQTDFMDNYEKHFSGGLMIGSIFQFRHPSRLGIDVNMGIFEKQKEITAIYLENGQRSTVYTKPTGLGFRLSVNLMYWFFH